MIMCNEYIWCSFHSIIVLTDKPLLLKLITLKNFKPYFHHTLQKWVSIMGL